VYSRIDILMQMLKHINALPVLMLLLIMSNTGYAQKVFSCEYRSDADFKVFVVDYRSDADLIVYKCDYSSDAQGNEGLWYFCEYRSDADKKIFFVDYRSDADLKIFFAEYRSDAGWQNTEKKHIMY
jgi:hypothetical protein